MTKKILRAANEKKVVTLTIQQLIYKSYLENFPGYRNLNRSSAQDQFRVLQCLQVRFPIILVAPPGGSSSFAEAAGQSCFIKNVKNLQKNSQENSQ